MDSVLALPFSLAFPNPLLVSQSHYTTVNREGVRSKQRKYKTLIGMFVGIKGRHFLLFIDPTASILNR